MTVTMKDVAKAAGVSVMTVSRVINNKEYIAAETREKVEAALKKLNYKPNINARTLVTKKTDFLGLIVPDIANPFFSDLVKAAENIARNRGYSVILGDSGGDPAVEEEYIEAFRGRMCDAIILIAPRVEDEVIRELNHTIPLVLVDRQIPDDDIIQVTVDNKYGALSAVEHLIGLGHRRIGFIMGPKNVPNAYLRREGYIEALRRHDIPVDEELIVQGDFNRETGARAFEVFNGLSDRPTAVFGSNDLMAFGFIQKAKEARYSIPRDFSVVGFDDIFLCALMEPPMTTVRYPIVEMGVVAIQDILNSLESKETARLKSKLKHTLIVRQSTAPLGA
ncbi:MAG: LacI family DNA-binding transcriptional regulator [Sediminispirochaetaceae bacterium]